MSRRWMRALPAAMPVLILFPIAVVAHGAPATGGAEDYVVVDGSQLGRYWRTVQQAVPSLPDNLLLQQPSGCVSATVRIEPDGSVHQVQRIVSHWSHLLPVYRQLLDARELNAIRRMRFAPASDNSTRQPVFSYVTNTFLSVDSFSGNPSQAARARAAELSNRIRKLCRVPDFVARIAQLTQAPAPAQRGPQH